VAFAAELATVIVVDFAPEEVGVKESWPLVQVPPAIKTAFAVQVPSACVNSLSEEANGTAPKVMDPPLAVKVTVPQVPVVLMPCVAEQVNEDTLTVKNAFDVPERAKLVPVPALALTVTVPDFAPEVAGLKVIVPGLQELPEAMVELAVQVPKATVKSVESLLVKGDALKTTGPPEAVRVIVLVQVTLEPALTAAQLTLPVAASEPLSPVPDNVNEVPVPALAATVTVSDLAPVVVGLKVIVPVVQEAPLASTLLAVQVPKGAAKSVLSVPLNGVADKVTGPPEAVKVIVPVLQVSERPAPKLAQVKDVGDAARVPLTPVPESAKVVELPAVGDAVTVSLFAPIVVGLNVIVPVTQVWPAVKVALAQVPAGTVKSMESVFANGVAPNTTVPPEAVIVTVPVLQVAESPAPTLAQVRDTGEAAIVPFVRPESTKLVPVPEVALTVTMPDLVPEVTGVKLIVPGLQELPEAMVELAVQVPSATVKSVESLLVKGDALKTTGPPEAVRVIVPVQVEDEPALTVGQLIVPVDAKVPKTPVPDAV
jgi:hypothetical protein